VIAHARHIFALAARQSDGSTLRDHYEARARLSGGEKARALLTPPECPAHGAYLFGWFDELHRRRGRTEHGPAPLTWADFDAWARLTKRTPSPWELETLAAFDDAYFAAHAGLIDLEPDAPRVERAWPASKDQP
jgi:hypothetical protein